MTVIEIYNELPFGGTEIVERKEFKEVSAACAFASAQRKAGQKHIVVRAPTGLSRNDCDILESLGVERL